MRCYFCLVSCLFLFACTSKVIQTPANLLNKTFPTVRGQSLLKEEVVIPDDLKGKLTLLLIGYQQKAQFDIDRWILGILQAEIPVDLIEVPTIDGMVPQMVQGYIDDGMRSGIPKKDWGIVVTVYEDASKIIQAIGNDRPQSAYAVLLNKDGLMVWASNNGYSASQVIELRKKVLELN